MYAGGFQCHVIGKYALTSATKAVYCGGDVFEVVHDVVWREVIGCDAEGVGVQTHLLHQCHFGRGSQRREGCGIRAVHVKGGFFQNRADARVGVLHVVHWIFVRLTDRHVDVEYEFGIGFARNHQEAHRVFVGPVHQVA